VKTATGSKTDEHVLRFENKQEAESALEEAMTAMRDGEGDPVKIAGSLVVVDSSITSADIFESAY
jgi:hypothetical protein